MWRLVSKWYEIIVLILYAIMSVLLNINVLRTAIDGHSVFMIPEASSIYLNNYLKTTIGVYAWNDFLSRSTAAIGVLSFRFVFWIIGSLLCINAIQLIAIERVIIQLIAFYGAFLLAKHYLAKSLGESLRKDISVATAAIAGFLYGTNPSFMIGDSFWIGIEFAFATLPWVLLSFSKAILDKNLKYSFICAIIMSINVDEHFLWAGFPLLLSFYAIFLTFLKLIRMKKVDYHPISTLLITYIIFLILNCNRIIFRLIHTSPYALSITKLGLDVNWAQATIINMLRAMSHPSLRFSYTLSVWNNLMPLTLSIPMLAALALLFYHRNWVVNFFSVIWTLSILPFFVGSPFKFIHYMIFFDTPIGPAFRTWRINDAYIALALSILMAFTSYYICNSFTRVRHFVKKLAAILTIILLTLTMFVYSYPIFTGHVTLNAVKIPLEYYSVHAFLYNTSDHFRAVYVPEFLRSYGALSPLKPFWSLKFGAIQEFLTFSSPKPTIWPGDWWSHFYYFTLSPFYWSLLRLNDTYALAHFLRWADIKYIVIHNDIPTIRKEILKLINFLNTSNNFKLIFHKDFAYIYENRLAMNKVIASPYIVTVSGGFRVVKKFIDALSYINSSIADTILSKLTFVFIDQNVPFDVINVSDIVLTDKPYDQLIKDLTISKLISDKEGYFIYPYKYSVYYNPTHKWSRASYLNAHQQEWHVHIKWQDYAWDFDYMKGIVFTINSNDSLVIPFVVNNCGDYVVMLRLMESDRGGEIVIRIDNTTYTIRTLNDYNGFLWYVLKLHLSSGKHNITIINVKGFNAISIIAIVPEEIYLKTFQDISKWLATKNVVNLNVNLITNPSFENSLNGWKMDEVVKRDGKFKVTLDNSTSFEGNFSLKVATNYTKTLYGWSWIRSEWINVKGGEEYLIITHMKAKNVNASHIVLVAYDVSRNRVIQLVQIPPASSGSFDWHTYKYILTIPENITKIRLVLNAGWSNKDGAWAITWFDAIKLIPIKSKYLSPILRGLADALLSKLKNEKIEIIRAMKIDPTLWRIELTSTKSFILVLSETYDPLWEARVYKDGKLIEKVRSIPVYGVINGFWINTTGNLTIVIRYVPQEWLGLGLKISASMFVLCIFYLVWDLRRSRSSR